MALIDMEGTMGVFGKGCTEFKKARVIAALEAPTGIPELRLCFLEERSHKRGKGCEEREKEKSRCRKKEIIFHTTGKR